MDKILRPSRLEIDPNFVNAEREFKHWRQTFENFLESIAIGEEEDRNRLYLHTLVNFVSSSVYQYISEITNYEEAILTLQQTYVKPMNEIFGRHLLATRRQQDGEAIDNYVLNLRQLAKNCNFQAVTAEQNSNDAIRDAFITGLSSQKIRQRLLENNLLTLNDAILQARALEIAEKNSEAYVDSLRYSASNNPSAQESSQVAAVSKTKSKTYSQKEKCFFCGMDRHSRDACPAREATCHTCGKIGHFSRVCNSSKKKLPAASVFDHTIASASEALKNNATTRIQMAGRSVTALLDTGSCHSFVSEELANSLKLKKISGSTKISMASSQFTATIHKYVLVDVTLQATTYRQVLLYIMPYLCCDVILGRDFMGQHQKVEIAFGGPKSALSICGLAASGLSPPSLFQNLSSDCKPVATRSRRFCEADKKFISDEVRRLLKDGIIEKSASPWRAQIVVTKNERHKKRMVIDYSQTINRFTYLDAHPLPRIDDMAQKVSQYKVFSAVDLKSAYHQVEILEKDRPYTAFEAEGQLYQFRRLPFGLTNGVACFQRLMDNLVAQFKLVDTFVYLDNVLICGRDQIEHDNNLKRFFEAVRSQGLSLNSDKSILSQTSVNFLGYHISNGILRPDPERLRPLRELPIPLDKTSLKRAMGLFSYYSQWVPNFSSKLRPLIESENFPLNEAAIQAFQDLKKEIEHSAIQAINENIPFVVETDASDKALAATLNQAGRPVAFFSRSLSPQEKKHSAVEKEACAIVEALRKWRHFLVARHFTLITDQRSVSYMFDNSRLCKIKNDKVLRWRIELSDYDYDIVFRPGKQNLAPDALSRTCGVMAEQSLSELKRLHESLCHPGVTRLAHFVRIKNLAFSLDDVRKITAACTVCRELKPDFYRPPATSLIKATQPFERLSMDFKGPLPLSSRRNLYILTIVDEFSRFPFAFPCSDMMTATVIKCLCELFSVFGMPCYIHTDRGPQFMSRELQTFLHSKGIATSRTSPYNPQGNGQCERYNDIIWKAVRLSLKSRGLPSSMWEEVLPDALHSIRSLLNTSTNQTPHERLFDYKRRSSFGYSIPTWLCQPGKVYYKRHVRSSKHEPLVDAVDLIHANPHYAEVRFDDGRQTTVPVRDLAPWAVKDCFDNESKGSETLDVTRVHSNHDPSSGEMDTSTDRKTEISDGDEEAVLRRSSRTIKAPDRYGVVPW